MLESLFGVALGKLLGKALDRLLPNRRRPGVTLDANKLFEQSATTARELGKMESDNAWLRKAYGEVIAKLQQDSHAADDPSPFDRALAELEKGNPETAEALFRDIVVENRREAAQAACNIGILAFRHDTQKALRAYEEALELDPNTGDAWFGVGNLQKRMGNLEEAEIAFGKLLDLGNRKGDDTLRIGALSSIGILLVTRGDLDMAKDKLMAALKLSERLGDQEYMARNYGDIGTVHLSRGDLVGAGEMYRKSLALNKELGNKEIVAITYGNIGIVLEKRGDLDGAEEMYRKSLVLSEELSLKVGMANAYGNLGGMFMKIEGGLNKAEEMLRKSLRISEDLGYKENMARSYVNLGFISAAQGDLAEACRLWKEARGLFSGLGARDMVKIVEQAMQNAGCPP